MNKPKISITKPDIEPGKVFVEIEMWEEVDTHPARATMGVWVENSDSATELHERGVAAAKKFMKQALQDIS